MRKTRPFPETRIDVETLRSGVQELAAAIAATAPDAASSISYSMMETSSRTERWEYDDVEEFYEGVRRPLGMAHVKVTCTAGSNDEQTAELVVAQLGRDLEVKVRHTTRGLIERVMRVFEVAAPELRLEPTADTPDVAEPRVFVGHGRSTQWRDLKDHLTDQHQYEVIAYETGARAGITIREVLENMLSESTFAVLVLTAEDEQAGGGLRARQNVIHEAGLFQGRLGFRRAIVLMEEGVESLSNLDGVQYIAFAEGRIRETFGDVLATLQREFGAR